MVKYELMKSPECCRSRNRYTSIIPGFGNFTTIDKSIGNKDLYRVDSSRWLAFRTALKPFWTSSSYYLHDSTLRASHLDSYFVLSLASFLQRMNDGFSYLRQILNTYHLWYGAIICLSPKISVFIPLFRYWKKKTQGITPCVNHKINLNYHGGNARLFTYIELMIYC